MDMDLFEDLTALAPPEDHRASVHTAGRTDSSNNNDNRDPRLDDRDEEKDDAKDADRSTDVSVLDESVSGLQSSADLSAFSGFQARIHADNDALTGNHRDEQDPTMRLALDLGSSARQHDFRPDGVSISQLSQNTSYSQQHFAELFYGDTQDDQGSQKSPHTAIISEAATETAAAAAAAAAKIGAPPTIFVTRAGEQRGVERSPSSTLLFSVEREWNKRNLSTSVKHESESSGGALQNSVPVGPNSKATEIDGSGQEPESKAARAAGSNPLLAAWRERESVESSDGEDFGHGPHFTRGTLTPPLATDADDNDDDDTEHARPTFASFTRTNSDDSRSASPLQRHCAAMAEADIEPMFSSYDDNDLDEHAYGGGRRDSIDSYPDTQSLGDDAEMHDVDDDGGVDMETAEKPSPFRPVSTAKELGGGEDDSDSDAETPTQRHTSAGTPMKTISPAQHIAASPSRIALKNREKGTPQAVTTLADSMQKTGASVSAVQLAATQKLSSASRNLAFSFATPDSQESQSLDSSASDVTMLAFMGSSAISEAERLTVAATAATAARKPSEQVSAKPPRKNDIPKTAVTSNATKKASASDAASSTGASSVDATPMRRKRKRAFVSPDAGMQATPTSSSQREGETPVRSKRVVASGGSSGTPSVRTRAKLLSSLPSNRVYASRTKTIFKYKFEFVLTGFINEGETNLMALIEEHGGKVAERYEDVLHKNNSKAVVIATPVSWRKLKFIYAIACGIPVVHPEWIHACAKAGQVVPLDGFCIPSGYSIVTRKFECLPVKQLDIFAGLSFGIPYDVVHTPMSSTVAMGSLIAFVLKACGAARVIEDLEPSRDKQVDVVLSDELTKTCKYYHKKHLTPVKNFSWVTECMILQRFLKPENKSFQPHAHNAKDEEQKTEQVLTATAEIGDSDRNKLKLHTGELVLADLSGNEIDHFLLFHVCEILRITVVREDEDDRKHEVMLEVGVLKRSPNSPGLSRVHSKTLEIPASHVKRRVVAVSKNDFQSLSYRDESIFYYEDGEHQEDGGAEENTGDDNGEDE